MVSRGSERLEKGNKAVKREGGVSWFLKHRWLQEKKKKRPAMQCRRLSLALSLSRPLSPSASMPFSLPQQLRHDS